MVDLEGEAMIGKDYKSVFVNMFDRTLRETKIIKYGNNKFIQKCTRII
jgi:hypothetical protein